MLGGIHKHTDYTVPALMIFSRVQPKVDQGILLHNLTSSTEPSHYHSHYTLWWRRRDGQRKTDTGARLGGTPWSLAISNLPSSCLGSRIHSKYLTRMRNTTITQHCVKKLGVTLINSVKPVYKDQLDYFAKWFLSTGGPSRQVVSNKRFYCIHQEFIFKNFPH